MDGIYLDNNATTRVDPLVVEAMLPFFTEKFGNPSSMHSFGDSVGRNIREARGQVQALLGAEFDHEIVFTSCGTESDNTAILSALATRPERREIITSIVEHPAVLSLCRHLEEHEGYRLHVIPVDRRGRLDIDAYVAALSPNVAVASIMWANNETGNLFPVEQLAKLAKTFGILFHTDAVQAVGKVPIDLKNSVIDMLSLSGHKLHAPKGIGALYVRRGTRFRPLLRGGHQERERRAGTENTTGIVGLGKACELALAHMTDENTRVRELRDRLEKGILESVGNCSSTATPCAGCPTPPTSLRVHRGRGHPASPQPRGHRRLVRVGLHVGIAGAVARHARHGRSVHRRPRLHPLLPFARQHRRADRPGAGGSAAHRRPVARPVAVLVRRRAGQGGLRARICLSDWGSPK